MKSLFKKSFKKMWNNEAAQGMAEYVLLIVIVLAIFAVFKDKIRGAITNKAESVGAELLEAK